MYICEYCGKEFEKFQGKANHVRWNHKDNTEYLKKLSKTTSKRNTKEFNEKLGEFKNFKVTCEKCESKFTVKEREKQFPKKEKYFCSKKCARSYSTYNKRKEINEKVSKRLRSGENQIKICKYCENEFEVRYTKRHQKFCSPSCATKFRYKEGDKLRKYRIKCSFKFNLKDYPDEFNFDLIKEHGWYQASNRGNNLGGVSRDHMYSVRSGFENNVDPSIISHPANCQLLVHNENISKNKENSISLEELKQRIYQWDKKYKNN